MICKCPKYDVQFLFTLLSQLAIFVYLSMLLRIKYFVAVNYDKLFQHGRNTLIVTLTTRVYSTVQSRPCPAITIPYNYHM